MMTRFDPQIIEILKTKPAERKRVCELEFAYFAIYYFSKFFTYPMATFHWEMFEDLKRLVAREVDEVDWVLFRESAKTSLAKMFMAWCICYKKKQYINFDSYDKDNSESALFDVAIWLQTNERIIEDFGQLYFAETNQAQRRSQMKRIGKFITENGVIVEAFSTQEPTRGRIHQHIRPDLFVLDDIENNQTKDSYARTKAIIDHINELRTGLGPTGGILALGNYITEGGVIAKIMEAAEKNPTKVILRNIPIMIGESLTWPGKYVHTEAEARKINAKRSPEIPVISIEAKKASVDHDVFMTEFMNDPGATSDQFFDRRLVDFHIERVAALQPLKQSGDLKIWHTFDASHRYAVGADTAGGVGKDSCASTIIDFTFNPARVAATFHDNQMAPDKFGFELRRQGDVYGECLLAPEKNNTGYATVAVLVEIYPVEKIYQAKNALQDDPTPSKNYGWTTTAGTRTRMFYEYRTSFENGEILIDDIDLLREMRAFTKADFNEKTSSTLVTRHFDLLTSACIAWQMRNEQIDDTAATNMERQSKLEAIKNMEPTKPLHESIGV